MHRGRCRLILRHYYDDFFFRKSRPEKEAGSDVSSQQQQATVDGDQIPGKASLPGLLEMDTGLWAHITHIQTNILPLPVPQQQVQQIAK